MTDRTNHCAHCKTLQDALDAKDAEIARLREALHHIATCNRQPETDRADHYRRVAKGALGEGEAEPRTPWGYALDDQTSTPLAWAEAMLASGRIEKADIERWKPLYTLD